MTPRAVAGSASRAPSPTEYSGRRSSRRSVSGRGGWRAWCFRAARLAGRSGDGGPRVLLPFGFRKSLAALLTQLLDQADGLLEVVDPLTDLRFEGRRNVDRGGLAFVRPAQTQRTVARSIVGSATAGRLAATPGHDDEAAVKETFGLTKELSKPAASLSLRCW